MNDKTAKLLKKEEIYPDGANTPTIRKEYACPCGQGIIVEESVPGFGDYFARLDCEICAAKYTVVEGCGHIWELREK